MVGGPVGNSMPRRRTSGFTLIELLVVIAIIALLIGILIPVLAEVRNSSRKVICLSNIRQISTGFGAYLNTFDGVYPFQDDEQGFMTTLGDPIDDCARRGPGRGNEIIALRLAPFLGDPLVWEQGVDLDGNPSFDRNGCPTRVYTQSGVFSCPSAEWYANRLGNASKPLSYEYSWSFYTDPKVVSEPRSQFEFTVFAYPNAPQRASNVSFPAQKIMYGESSDNHDIQEEGVSQNWYDPVGSRNFLFADGHVSRHEMMEIRLTNLTAFDSQGNFVPVPSPHATIDGIRGYDLP